MTSRTVFITGAAAGIGRATALTFARKGWTVGGYDLDEAGLATLVTEVEAVGATAVVGRLDVTDADAFRDAVDDFVRQTGRLDVLVNNAGILLAGKFEDIDVARHHKEIDVNVRGVVNGAHAAHPHLKPGSTLVNLCSASAIYGQAELANYSATKFFVRGLTEALDIEWGPQGIRVVALWPLFVQTAMLEGVRTGTTDTLGVRLGPQDVADEILATVEPGRAARAIHQVHFPVGRQTQVLSVASRFSPAWLTRVVNKRFAAH
ncbi:NAD(P)-dependent dehydrogenase (short-subunit alcohol dehydrogenase family) [Nocardioides zeae]|uniref:NAD(P)-dependent dehydrogenase (Short-subunit alcohol dehydrogenase family) n=1 Tax=Nocardioides zeae TaxID=1457234 RepID=A0ACC6IN13_9ACTN|nr:SDR family oxidoreductase [Nocardioides zeae]MDR6174415.1 NAD(P)-dependent dehydrogenase (short-subunit alcohol dehydrogenase family) [Nocardioides zeae]MDR6212136.1 NAD(P)-dependent dehydrogenase (short-subunit alcohol dehydrogenase family) [Nocardioides zeae]